MTAVAEDALRHMLDFLHLSVTSHAADFREKGYAYGSIYEFVLKHGESFTPRSLPSAYSYQPVKECFRNAILLAASNKGVDYVEGYALAYGLPIHHAWNAEVGDQHAIDSTWPKKVSKSALYLGVRIPMTVAITGIASTGSALDDWQAGWPLFRQPWDLGT